MTIPAPRDAPLDTPRVKGEARGFLSTDCTAVPQAERAAPVRNPSSTRGRRIVIIMLTLESGTSSSPEPKRALPKIFSRCAGGTKTLPAHTPVIIADTAAIKVRTIPKRFVRFIPQKYRDK